MEEAVDFATVAVSAELGDSWHIEPSGEIAGRLETMALVAASVLLHSMIASVGIGERLSGLE